MTVFVVDTYNQYSGMDKKVARYVYKLHDQWYAIKEYEVKDGKLMRPLDIDEEEGANDVFYWHDTFESAKEYVDLIRRIN